MERKLKVGLVGGTGMVGQRLMTLLQDHPWFEVTMVAASPGSAGKSYAEAVRDRWKMSQPLPERLAGLTVQNAERVSQLAEMVDLVFCAVSLPKAATGQMEEAFAKAETPVISCNSAHRLTPDVPMLIPEINPEHLALIDWQKKRLGTKNGFIAVKPNCSIQSFVPPLHALRELQPARVVASTYQAISGAGKTFADWPEMVDNVIPFIPGEEEKSEIEPLKIWGAVADGQIAYATAPVITTQCIRVPVTDGHLATVFVSFAKKPDRETILERWRSFQGRPQALGLPSAPRRFIHYFDEEDRPQTRLDRDFENGMGITVGRLRQDTLFDYKFVALSHNTLRGAAGGAVLIAELLRAEGYLSAKA
ncbi:aspartate semialdehyde dehydrogenase [Hydrogenispora ethanolica]|uniref:Aspartate semialdehyde dehydrogenase n=1 Tax=Hydrogenispora ethanolica TaxID=1082276 RepID=A0A4R1R9D8_HYDET|nr:aspartate-semialdehyde dehydrogenase [Hydrogenispora ethanolica]TCL62199.1 aspartate semialdehyde dehydrogenase [Hydrogenispora ethanolica]